VAEIDPAARTVIKHRWPEVHENQNGRHWINPRSGRRNTLPIFQCRRTPRRTGR
jgi:hypothetical protein